MIVKVIVKGALEKYVSQNQVEVNIQEGAELGKVGEVLKEKIGIPGHIPTFIVVNQEKISKDYILKENDTIIFVTLIGGG